MRPLKARRWLIAGVLGGLCALAGTTVIADLGGKTAYAEQPGAANPPCATPTGPPSPVTPTTIATIQQAFYCIFAHYVAGGSLDDRPLLTGAFAGFTQELDQRGLDLPDATAPALTGDHDHDWAGFSAVYQRITGKLPADPELRQALAAATMDGMLGSLHDNHVGWNHPVFPPGYQPGEAYGFGFATAPSTNLATAAPREALAPLFITTVFGGPASRLGLRPGDNIVAVNGAPPFTDGLPSPGVMALLSQVPPRSDQIQLTLHRPATGRTWSVPMKPMLFQPTAGATDVVTSTLLNGDVADVHMTGFAPNAADQVRQAIAKLATGRTLHGVILDLRGNGGGSPTEVARLLGAFTHDKVWSYDCDAADTCTANHTDGTVPLLQLPLVVLTDRDCASACDAFSGAVKDLHLGTLIGTRTAGVVSGPASGYRLSDNSMLRMPRQHEKGANGEIINGIGVAPDIYLPLTAHDLSTGHDPDTAKALAVLGR
jgi:carboxyl-terminal processing protease